MSDENGSSEPPTGPAPDPRPSDGMPPSTGPIEPQREAAPQATSPSAAFLDRIPGWAVPAILLGVPLLVALLAKLSPSFYDNVVWQDYWGPIKADAQGQSILYYHGIAAHSGYNLVNTASWAVLLAVCLLGIAKLLRWTGTPMDDKLIVGATGWVVAGSIFHVMEDTGLIRAPLQYFFITPPIYLLFGAGGVATLVIGHYLRHTQQKAGLDRALQKLWFILAIPVLVYLAMWLKDREAHQILVAYVNPVWVALFDLAAYLLAVWRFRKLDRIEPADLVGILSIGWILFALAYTVSYVQHPWANLDGALPNPAARIPTALWAPVLAAAVTAIMFVVALLMVGRAERKQKPKSRDFWFAFFQPINLLLLFSQMLDGFATAIGIDYPSAFHYNEKHVLSSALIELARNTGDKYHIGFLSAHPTFFGFTTVKFVISLLVIGAIDGGGREEGEAKSPIIGLVKFAIIMVGIGPGIRDFVRMSLGV